MPPEEQVRFDAGGRRREPLLAQPDRFSDGERLVGEVCQWFTAPQIKCLPQAVARKIRIAWQRDHSVPEQPVETGGVNALRIGLQHVTRAPSRDRQKPPVRY